MLDTANNGDKRQKQSKTSTVDDYHETAADGTERLSEARYKLRISYTSKPLLGKVASRLKLRGVSLSCFLSPMGEDPGCVYFAKDSEGNIKIGFSRNPDNRMKRLRESTGREHSLLAFIPGVQISSERIIHRAFEHCRLHGEWFSPASELLSLIAEIQAQDGARC